MSLLHGEQASVQSRPCSVEILAACGDSFRATHAAQRSKRGAAAYSAALRARLGQAIRGFRRSKSPSQLVGNHVGQSQVGFFAVQGFLPNAVLAERADEYARRVHFEKHKIPHVVVEQVPASFVVVHGNYLHLNGRAMGLLLGSTGTW